MAFPWPAMLVGSELLSIMLCLVACTWGGLVLELGPEDVNSFLCFSLIFWLLQLGMALELNLPSKAKADPKKSMKVRHSKSGIFCIWNLLN
jgi:hypothetical protein